MDFTFEEMNLMSIYNGTGTRQGLISALREMSGYLESDETELRALTASALKKLESMSDDDFAELELVPDFDAVE
ncbi:transposon-transfer assisting family protein [Clostridiaceae bacterium OttesenSCG-928-D20]|nr:transposon-transfer assisting family protein [Clostridiaceae bacterium OttesenSCG-928-D20]